MQKEVILTNVQIENLYKFCARHYVHYYDLQTELVDHLASAIEEKMNDHPALSFEKALDDVYKGFGVMGFAPLVSGKMMQLERAQLKLKWQFFKKAITPPALFTTLLLPVFLVLMAQLNPTFFKDWGTYALIGVGMLFQVLLIIKIFRISGRQQKKLLLTHNGFIGVSFGNSIFIFLNILHWRSTFDFHYDWWSFGYVTLYSVAVLMVWLHYQYISLVYASAREQYPAAFT
jgi:hypothetical protein